MFKKRGCIRKSSLCTEVMKFGAGGGGGETFALNLSFANSDLNEFEANLAFPSFENGAGKTQVLEEKRVKVPEGLH